MAERYYAVKSGRKPGIYRTWQSCKPQVNGYAGADFRVFRKRAQAEAYLTCPVPSKRRDVVLFVDGSYMKNRGGWGFVALMGDDLISKFGGFVGNIPSRNIGMEIIAAKKALAWAKENGFRKVTLRYDYSGIGKWADGEWVARKPFAKAYQAYVDRLRKEMDVVFQKVAAHSGEIYNAKADQLAKEGARTASEPYKEGSL